MIIIQINAPFALILPYVLLDINLLNKNAFIFRAKTH